MLPNNLRKFKSKRIKIDLLHVKSAWYEEFSILLM
jgi:hypothetical protein